MEQTQPKAADAGSRPACSDHLQRVRRMVEELGEARTAEQLGVGRATVARVVANLPLRAGTRSLLREALGAEAGDHA
jgi:hypothetical protein